MTSIKGLVIRQGQIVNFKGMPHYVKSYDVITGHGIVVDLCPISEDVVKASIEEVDVAPTTTRTASRIKS